MPLVAKTAAELVKNNFGKYMIELEEAEGVEFIEQNDGRVWLNVDGICLVRIANNKAMSEQR